MLFVIVPETVSVCQRKTSLRCAENIHLEYLVN